MKGPQGPAGPARAQYSWQQFGSNATTLVRYLQVSSTTTGNNESLGRVLVMYSTTLVRLDVRVTGTPFTTDSCTFTLRKNGVDTALTVALGVGATAVNITGSVSVAPGDILTMKAVQSGSEAVSLNPRVAVSEV